MKNATLGGILILVQGAGFEPAKAYAIRFTV